MLLGIIQSVESLNRKKRRRREEFAVCLSWDHLLPLDISVLVLRPLDSDQNLYHWPPNSQAFRDKLGLTPSTPMVHRPLDFNWITPLFSFWFGLVCFSSSSLLMASLGTFLGIHNLWVTSYHESLCLCLFLDIARNRDRELVLFLWKTLTQALSILIIVVLTSWSDNFDIPAGSGSCSNACSVCSKHVFHFSVCLIIFSWKVDMLCPGKGTIVNRPLVMWCEVSAERKSSLVL